MNLSFLSRVLSCNELHASWLSLKLSLQLPGKSRISNTLCIFQANAAYSPPVVRRTSMVRASSVPPQFGRPPVRVTKVSVSIYSYLTLAMCYISERHKTFDSVTNSQCDQVRWTGKWRIIANNVPDKTMHSFLNLLYLFLLLLVGTSRSR